MRRLSCLLAVVQRSPKGMLGRRVVGAVVVALPLIVTASPAVGATTLPALWTAGGLSAGIDSAGQAARIASDASGNVAVVSGPSGGRDLAVTSYTADGTLRWRSTVTPALGTFVGDWVVAAPNGDFVVIGHNQDSHGRPIASTMLRYDSNGTLLWRVDFSASFFPAVARLVVDAAGNAYVAWSAVGSGLFVQKYSPAGALLWSQQADSTTGGGYAIASSLALSPDGADVAVTGSVSGGATWITAVYDATTGVRRWQVTAAEGTAARDVVVDATRVYVTGQGVTGAGTPALAYYLTVVAYDRATGARLWRKDKKPADGYDAAGLWMAMAPDGSLVVTGQTNRGFLDWYTVAFETTGAVRWEAVRDGGLNTDEIPAGVLVTGRRHNRGDGKRRSQPSGRVHPGCDGRLQLERDAALGGVLEDGHGLGHGASEWRRVCRRRLRRVHHMLAGLGRGEGGDVRRSIDRRRASPRVVRRFRIDDSQRNDNVMGMVIRGWRLRYGASDHPPVRDPGTYTASLTVTDSTGASSVATGSIVANPSPPAAPSGLTAAALTRSSIGLTWTNGSTSQTEVRIERCRGVGCTNFTQVAAVAGTATSFINTGLTARTTYRYRVRGHNALGDSPYSNIAGVRTK